MTTFSTGSGVGDNYATLLVSFPDTDWFRRCMVNAIDEMTLEFNWTENGDVGISFAVEEAQKSLEGLKILGFNPFPVGLILPFAGNVAPDGYLLCDGSSHAIADYPELYAIIGTIYGGSGSDFTVPDLRNNTIVGSGDFFTIAQTGGEPEHTLTVGELAAHSHIADSPAVTDLGHTHSEITALPTAITIGAGVPAPSAVPSVGITGLSFTGISVGAPNIHDEGSNEAHNNMQPFLAVPYIIYAGR